MTQEPFQWVRASNLTISELCVLIAEEASEVAKAATKAQRFGILNHHPNRTQTNLDELLEEYTQLRELVITLAGHHNREAEASNSKLFAVLR